MTTTFENEGTTASTPVESSARTDLTGELIDAVLASLEDAKAEDIVTLEIGAKSSLADQMVIVSGRSHRHVGAIADYLVRDVKLAGGGNPSVEGMNTCDWVLIDAGDVIVHVFRPEVRGFYNLEKMWSPEPEDLPKYVS